ncbi:MAG: methyltransferase domain-containing protein [Solirubrobacterales bacterium]|nr:methyltransferase domain-containing protein [Solirubrobacterales bacterium]
MFEITFPPKDDRDYDQDEEWCEVAFDGEQRRIRFHDYDEIYSIPGLYDQLFYDELRCDSPRTLCALLADCIAEEDGDADDLRVLDLGAGNGKVGEQLKLLGADSIVGMDLIEEAAAAADRDQPGVYDDYLVGDITELSEDVRDELSERRFNCLTSVAALGFDDIPPEAFAHAHNLIEPGGWIVFNIKEEFISEQDDSGFSRLIRQGLDDDSLQLEADRRYRHRLSIAGDPIHYVGMVARKQADLPVGVPG